MGQSPAKATAKKKWAFSERKARESRNLYLLLGFGSAAAAFAAAATALGAAAPFCSWLGVRALFSSRVVSRSHAVGSQHRDQASPLGGCARADPLPLGLAFFVLALLAAAISSQVRGIAFLLALCAAGAARPLAAHFEKILQCEVMFRKQESRCWQARSMEVAGNQVGALKAARGAVCCRRRASRRLAVPRRGAPRKKWPVSLGCRGLLGPPDGAWG